MNSNTRLLFALTGVLIAVQPVAFAAAPTVEETIVGPAGAGGVYVLSPAGARIAYAGLKGTRLVVTVDGVEGPVFDELYTAQGQSFVAQPNVLVARSTSGGMGADPLAPVLFSPDGAHYAYVGRQGNECVVIHDGKEVARVPRERMSLNYGTLTLSPDGGAVYFMEMDRPASGNAKWRLNVGGKPGPWSSNNHGMNIMFNADGSRHAYNAAGDADTRTQVLVVDGKVASYAGTNPVFTADGKSLLTVSTATAANPKPAVLVNGKPAFTALSVDKIIPAPVGGRWGAIARTKLEGYTQVPAFFLDGKEVPGTEGAQAAWFSADGKHYAVACQNMAARSMFMVVDGKVHREYQGIGVDPNFIWWTPDGSKFIYTVTAGGRPFLIVNEEEIPITMLIGQKNKITMAQSGGRYGYGLRDGSNRIHSLVVDGVNGLPEGTRPYDDSLVFSPDGSRYGFFAGPAMRNEMSTLVLDGAVQDGVTPGYFANWVAGALVSPSFAFSGDGKHVAWIGRSGGAQRNGLYMDGKLVAPDTRAVFYPTFTPDNAHFYWVEEQMHPTPGQGAVTVVFVDGVEAVRANGRFFWPVPGTFTVDSGGVATFFAADGASVKRYRITPPEDTSVATLLEKGDQLIAAAAAAVVAEQARIAEAAAAAQRAKDEAAAAAVRAREEQAARVAAAQKARQEALEAKQKARLLQLENAKRARQGLPPLKELPEGN